MGLQAVSLSARLCVAQTWVLGLGSHVPGSAHESNVYASEATLHIPKNSLAWRA
jgi:hypothetical protein